MNVQNAKRMIRLKEWAAQINECKQSGLTVRRWCNENGVKVKTFYNRMRLVREEVLTLIEDGNTNLICEAAGLRDSKTVKQKILNSLSGNESRAQSKETVFAALPITQIKSPAVTVHMGEYIIDIQNSADSTIVEQVLRQVAQL